MKLLHDPLRRWLKQVVSKMDRFLQCHNFTVLAFCVAQSFQLLKQQLSSLIGKCCVHTIVAYPMLRSPVSNFDSGFYSSQWWKGCLFGATKCLFKALEWNTGQISGANGQSPIPIKSIANMVENKLDLYDYHLPGPDSFDQKPLEKD